MQQNKLSNNNLPADQLIISSCRISNGVAYRNNEPVFENREDDLPGFLLSFYRYLDLQYPKFHKMDNLSKLGWLAVELLLIKDFQPGKYQPEDIGIVFANSSASLDTDIKFNESVKTFASPSLFVYTLPNIMIGEICIRNNFKGENAFFVFDSFDLSFVKDYVSCLFSNNKITACICGWIEFLDDRYEAFLFLVENIVGIQPANAVAPPTARAVNFSYTKTVEPVLFTVENLNNLYRSEHG
ncbi:MAG: hypothetical protein WKF89_03890 [Chitinophagaceae bacterium]